MWSWIRLLQGCADLSAPDELYIEGEPVERVSVPAFGGSVAANEAWVAASDVDGDKIIFRSEGSETHQLVLPSGWAPGPLLFGRDGVVHVLLRGTGSLLSVDPGLVPDGFAGPSLEDLRPVCEAPRGIGLDPRDGRVWVACAGGELVGMGAGEDQIRYLLDSDLRDVVPLPDGRALVSRLREAEVLLVDLDSGQLEQRFSPNTVFSDGQTLIPRVARRMIPYRDKALLLFQAHQQEEVDERVGYNGIVTDVVVEVGPHGISIQ